MCYRAGPVGFLSKCLIWTEMILVTKWFGTFLCVEGSVKKAVTFPKSPSEIAERLDKVRNGLVLEEEQSLGGQATQVYDRRLSGYGRRVRFDSSFIKPEDYGFTIDLYREATIELAKRSIKSSIGPDVFLGHAVRAYDDLVFTNNMLSERLHEWYSLHFPELTEVLSKEVYAAAISDQGARDAIMTSMDLKMDSVGADVQAEDLEPMRLLASALRRAYDSRRAIEEYVEARMRQVAPNVCALAGPVVGARLIMQAGSLSRLASMPSGTIQLLGAEKAMFRHMKKKTDPPKHGLIFQHPLVHNAPVWQRGPIARALASKISVAARADAYTRADLSETLKEQIEKRVEEIRKQRPNPPKKPAGKRRKSRR
jgi:nucleolar protein 56